MQKMFLFLDPSLRLIYIELNYEIVLPIILSYVQFSNVRKVYGPKYDMVSVLGWRHIENKSKYV